MTYLYDSIHILVGLGCLLSDHFHACGSNYESTVLQGSFEFGSTPFSFSGRTGHESTRAMRSSPEAQFHGPRGTNQDPAARSHTSRDQNGLTNLSVFGRNVRMSRWEGSGRPFSMHDDLCQFSVDLVGLYLSYIVADIVDDLHVQRVWGSLEHLLE